MRILHVIHSLDPRSGGPSYAIRQICRAQADAGTIVALLATTTQACEPWEPRDDYINLLRGDRSFDGIELVLKDAFGRRGPWQRFAYSPQARNWLRERLADRVCRPDVIHIHGVFNHIGASAARYARANRIPYVICPHGALDPKCFETGARWLKRGFVKLLLQRDLRDSACIHAMSDIEASAVRPWVAGDRVRVIALGVDVPEYDRAAAAEILLSVVPQVRGRRIILFLSRVAAKKRAEMLVDALALLRDELPNVVLLIVGQDSGGMQRVREAVERNRIDDRVVFTGFLQGDKKRAAFAAADVFALPSMDESFGVAVVEAMANGLPVIVTEGVAAHTYVDDCGCGCTVADNAAALAAGLRQTLADDCAALGRRGREYVAQHLGWPPIVQQLDEMYRNARIGMRPDSRERSDREHDLAS